MELTMTSQAAKIFLEDFTNDELQAVKEIICEACKGDNICWWDSDCRFYCGEFIKGIMTAYMV